MALSEDTRRKAAERMKARVACPEFQARWRAGLQALHARPEFAAQNSARMRARCADPAFQARRREALKAWRTDPDRNPLAALTAQERADYDLLVKRGRIPRNDAFRAINRLDLVRT